MGEGRSKMCNERTIGNGNRLNIDKVDRSCKFMVNHIAEKMNYAFKRGVKLKQVILGYIAYNKLIDECYVHGYGNNPKQVIDCAEYQSTPTGTIFGIPIEKNLIEDKCFCVVAN